MLWKHEAQRSHTCDHTLMSRPAHTQCSLLVFSSDSLSDMLQSYWKFHHLQRREPERHEDVDKSWGNCCGGGGWEREGEREKGGGVIVEKLDIASLLHLTPSTSDLLDVTECTYCKDSNDQHPHPNANRHFSIFIYNFQDASRSIYLSREWIKL